MLDFKAERSKLDSVSLRNVNNMANNTSLGTEEKKFPFELFAAPLDLFGIAGNLMVVIAVWKKRSLRSTTNYLLVNRAISDVLSLVFLPLMVIQTYVRFEEGILADFMCKFIMSFHVPITASFVSTITLVVLSVERYHAIVKPMKTGFRLREDTMKYAYTAVWISATVLTLPIYIYGYYDRKRCHFLASISKTAESVYKLLVMTTIVFIPFCIISFCYFQIVRELYFKKKVGPQNLAAQEETRNKRKLVQVSITVTVVFMVCYFPLASTLFLSVHDVHGFDMSIYQKTSTVYFMESIFNPILYIFQSTNFRNAFKEILRCRGNR